MSNKESGPLQGRFDISGGELKEDRPFPVNKAGESTQLFTTPDKLHTEIMVEMGLLGELGRRFDAGLDIGDQYSEVAARIKRKLLLT